MHSNYTTITSGTPSTCKEYKGYTRLGMAYIQQPVYNPEEDEENLMLPEKTQNTSASASGSSPRVSGAKL